MRGTPRSRIVTRLTLAGMLSLLTVERLDTRAATTTDSETMFGCEVAVRRSVLEDEQLVARAAIDCPTPLEGRQIVVELQQLDSVGIFTTIPSGRVTYDVADTSDGLERLGSRPVGCRPIAGKEQFRTQVRIDVAPGAPTPLVSEPCPRIVSVDLRRP